MTGIQVHPTGYGPPAARRLHEVIAAAKGRDPLRPVTVVVPTNSVGVATRRSLASDAWGRISEAGRGIAGLSILTVYRLGELLGAASLAAQGRRPVSTPVIAAAVRCVLADDPGVFAPVVDHPATEASLVAAHRELSACSQATLDLLAGAGRRSADVVRIHRRVRTRLHEDWYDEADLMDAAVGAIRSGASVLDDVGEVVLYLPQDLSPAAGEVVATLADVTTVHAVVGLTGDDAADADVHRTLDRIGAPAVPAVARPADAASALVVDQVMSVSDAEEEVRTAVEHVLRSMDQHDTPAERIAVVHPSSQPYATIVHEQLAAAGIAWNGAAHRSTTERLAARWLLDVLDLPERAFSRAAVLGVLGGPPRGRLQSDRVDPATAERLSRDAGVVDTVPGWIQRLTRLADDRREAAQQYQDIEDRDWLVDRMRRDADDADRLRGAVIDLATELERAEQLGTWAALTGWLRELLHSHLGAEHERMAWPEEERRAADRVESAIDRISALDAIEPTADVARLRRTLELELDSGLGRTGSIGRGVLVGRPADTLGVDLDLVIVLGMSEGVFPRRPREDSLLAEHERELVADELPPRSTRVATQHRHLLAALAAAPRRVLVHPRGDLRRSIDRAPSRWLLDAVEATTGRRQLTDQDPAVVTVVASFADRVARTELPADDQAFHLRTLAADPSDPAPSWLAAFAAGRRLLHARAGDAFTAFDGNVASVADLVRSPADLAGVASASALQAWVSCPHGYLLRYVLGVRPVEVPEERLEISPIDLGLLVHRILEDWLEHEIAHGVPDPSSPWDAASRERLRVVAHERCREWQDAGRTGHPRLWDVTRRRVLRELEAFLDDDDRTRRSRGSWPVATEMAFGPHASQPALTIDLGDGRAVRFGGFVDRVDRTADGGVVVTDYKTGSTYSYEGLGPENLVGDGSHLQLLIYGLAAHQAFPDATRVHAEYLFTREKDAGTRIGYDVDGGGAEVLTDVIRLVTDHIEAGVFPLRPVAPGWQLFTPCLYCDPDELGTADRHRDWERLRLLPALRDYVAQVEPEALDAAEVSA